MLYVFGQAFKNSISDTSYFPPSILLDVIQKSARQDSNLLPQCFRSSPAGLIRRTAVCYLRRTFPSPLTLLADSEFVGRARIKGGHHCRLPTSIATALLLTLLAFDYPACVLSLRMSCGDGLIIAFPQRHVECLRLVMLCRNALSPLQAIKVRWAGFEPAYLR